MMSMKNINDANEQHLHEHPGITLVNIYFITASSG